MLARRSSRRPVLALAAALVVAVALPVFPSAAHAAPGEGALTLTFTQVTGTGPFDSDDSPGRDSSATNDIVRTNDTVTYTTGVRYEGENHTTPRITLTLPRGEELVQLPAFCLAGSSVSPATVPAPVAPVTATSWTTLPQQTVTCVVAGQAAGSSIDYAFVSKVRPEVPQATVLGPVTFTAATDQVTTPVQSSPLQHTVSAAPRFDLSKRGTATSDNTGPFISFTAPCSFDAARGCYLLIYPITVSAPGGGKGASPLTSPMTFVEDLSPDALYGAGTTTSAAWLNAGAGALDRYGARIRSCDPANANLRSGTPYSEISGGLTATNAVRDSGSISCANPQAPGTTHQVTITDADTTAYTVPTIGQDGGALQGDSGYVVSLSMTVEVPLEAVSDLGSNAGGVETLGTRNTFSAFTAVDIAGQPNAADPLPNNTRAAVLRLESPGSFTKYFAGVTGAPRNTPDGSFMPGLGMSEGMPGSVGARDGQTVVVPGQTVLSFLWGNQFMVPGVGGRFDRTRVMCDVWDDDVLRMPVSFSFAGSGATNLTYLPSGGEPAWISGWMKNNVKQPSIAALPNVSIQYSAAPVPGNGAASACTTGTWYDAPEDVPGAVQENGQWVGVNRVRMSYSSFGDAVGSQFYVGGAIALVVQDTGQTVGTVLPNWASTVLVDGQVSMDQALATGVQTLSSYTPADHGGALGDRLILGGVTARIAKAVRNGPGGAFTETAVPQYSSGNTVDYRLSPTLTVDSVAPGAADVTIEDCLPLYQQFLSSTREGSGAPLTPEYIGDGSPTGAALSCPAGQQYLRWVLPSQVLNDPIDPIVYTVEILATARNGSYINTTIVSTPSDPSPLSRRTDTAQIQLAVPTGIRIAKSTPQSIVEVNPAGVTTARTLQWDIDFANIDSPVNVANVDVIDVLPADGIGGSDFTGTVELTSVTLSGVTTGTQVRYTAAAPASLRADPTDATNGASGATVWCSAPTGGTVVSGAGSTTDCPTSIDEVTGLRFVRAGTFEPSDRLSAEIVMTPAGNAEGDLYRNATAGRADGVSQQVGPATRDIRIVASSIGDRVWNDLDADGVQDAGEPGVAGWPVRLLGTDVDGNAVDLTTTTDTDGLYTFAGLASGDYQVVFTRAPMPDNTTWTLPSQGTAADDSDVDPLTGRTPVFALGLDVDDPTRDAGIVVDLDTVLTLDKTLVSTAPLDDRGQTTVVYDVTVTNTGTATAVYDLDDQVRFGAGVTVQRVTAAGASTGSGAVSTTFDGISDRRLVTAQRIAGNTAQVYRVTVLATVTQTSTASSRDCDLGGGESGTGFLNAAALTVGSTIIVDTACGVAPPPPAASASGAGLAVTGTAMPFWTIGGALVALVIGAGLLVLRRRRA